MRRLAGNQAAELVYPTPRGSGADIIQQQLIICHCEPVWPSGGAAALDWLWSRGTSVRIRFGFPFSSKVVVCGHWLVTLSLTINETLKLLWSLPILMQAGSHWLWWVSVAIVIWSPSTPPYPLFPAPNKDVKHWPCLLYLPYSSKKSVAVQISITD